MSKKKAFSGSTMTLKDFHGGSIPSDLPLPSAPGVMVRSSDRSPFDRQIPTPPWGSGSIARSDHRSRPGSSGPTRTFDEKTSFLSVPNIGRNFDEDERKPFDGGVTRRPISEDAVRAPPVARPDPKPVAVRQASTAPVVHSPPTGVKLTAGPNAWASRREVAEPTPPAAVGAASAWSGQSVVSKFAQASAVEKISSGRWQSKTAPVYHHPPDVEVIRFAETETEADFGSGANQIDCRSEFDPARGKFGERGVSPLYLEAKERMYPEAKERSSGFVSDGNRPASTDGKSGVGSQSPAVTEASERPKLKLLPRTKPVEPSEAHLVDHKQGYLPAVADSGHVESGSEFFGNGNPPKPGSAGGEGSSRAVERPRLNLKPRSQPLEQSDVSAEMGRKSLFGGARPRELVLKDRGVDEVVINNLDLSQSANRVKHEGSKHDTKPETPPSASRYTERPENLPADQRAGKDFERKDHQPDTDKVDMQRNSWRNDNRRNGKETEKLQELRQEPESWRKPIEPPKQPMPEVPGQRLGRVASALELAQTFSRTMSDTKSTDRFTSQRSLPGRTQVPFSRLTDTRDFYSGPATRQINGY